MIPSWFNWLAVLPPLFGIYLLIIASVARGYLSDSVNQLAVGKAALDEHREVIKHVALSWATKLSFLNTILPAFISLFAIYSRTKAYDWAAGSAVLLIMILAPMGWYTFTGQADQLTSDQAGKSWPKGWTRATVIKGSLLLVNVVILVGTIASQWLAQQATPPVVPAHTGAGQQLALPGTTVPPQSTGARAPAVPRR
jgi:hypothetical protein